MNALKSIPLVDRGVIKVSGPDAKQFLQGLITNDMDLLQNQKAIHAGLLSPQGKILFDFFVVNDGDAFLLDVARHQSVPLKLRLGMYRLHSNVTIENVSPNFTVVALWGDTLPTLPKASDPIHFTDPRLEPMGMRILVTIKSGWLPSKLDATPATQEKYDAHRISLGVPEGGKDYAFGETFIHEALFDQLNGVSFSKGCFIGQEVVSRMQHRATARRRIVPIEGHTQLPPKGTEIRAGSSLIGTVCSVAEKKALANLRLDRVQEALKAGQPLKADDIEIEIKLPSWATFSLSAPSTNEKTEKPKA